jgi:phosphotransacetylase/acyl dehydratase
METRMNRIENRTFVELQVGDSASISRTLTRKDIELFAIMSGDVNPAHVDEEFARSDMFHRIIAHGMWGGALISTVLGTQLPGPGAIYLGQSLRFRKPVCVGDTITVTVTVAEKNTQKNRITLDCQASNQKGEVVISGTAEVIAPTEKISRERVVLPEVKLLEKGRHFQTLLSRAQGRPPLRTAVVHPVDANSLLGAIEAFNLQLIMPILVGPEGKIRAAAERAQVDISDYEISNTEHSHAAAELAVTMARQRQVDAIMKGSLAASELMHFVDTAQGLRTQRRISHIYAVDVPSFPRILFITDAAVNAYPAVEDKRDIVQNAIDLARAVGVDDPKVAILSAQEKVSVSLPSTVDAAVLCKMAERSQISGGVLDGPLGFDVAVSAQAAEQRGVNSAVAGQADVLVVPDLEAGNMLAEQLNHLADAQLAGVVAGARVPVILPNPAEQTLACLTSCAMALLLSEYKRIQTTKAVTLESEAAGA